MNCKTGLWLVGWGSLDWLLGTRLTDLHLAFDSRFTAISVVDLCLVVRVHNFYKFTGNRRILEERKQREKKHLHERTVQYANRYVHNKDPLRGYAPTKTRGTLQSCGGAFDLSLALFCAHTDPPLKFRILQIRKR